MSDDLELLQGTLDVLILKALANGPAHGYSVARWIRQQSGEAFLIEDRALYVALHRMDARGWVTSSWGLSDNNRKAKYYDLTRAGRRALSERMASWRTYSTAMNRVLGTA